MLIVFALSGAYAVYCLVTNPAGPATAPDSFHYLNMTPIVPLGYPFFLQLTGARGAIVAQPILFSAALALLGYEIVRATRSTWLAVAIMLGTMIVPQIREFHASILSESLFLTLLVIVLALAVRFTYHPMWRLMVLVAITAGMAATVRRTAFALLPVMLVMVLLADFARASAAAKAAADRSSRQAVRSRFGNASLFLVAAFAPFAAIAAIEQVIAPVVHAGAPSSLLGRHAFAKAALIDAPPAPATEDRVRRALDDQLDNAFAPIRTLLASAPGNVRGVLTLYYETCLQGRCADRARTATGQPNEARETAVMGAVGLARIRRAPLNFLRLTWMHYRSLWTFDRLRHPDTAADLNAFLATHRPLPYEELAALGPDKIMEFSGAQNVRYAQYAISAVAIVTGVLALAGCVAAIGSFKLPPALQAACVAALTLHAGLVLTALLAAGFTRFLLGLWPALVVASGFGGLAVWEKVKNKN
jgi:hypothetical protein